MRLLSTQEHLSLDRGCVASIGNFDGIHFGHQAVLSRVVEKASQLGLPSLVILFEPQGREFFLKDKAPVRLTRLREKYRLLKLMGINFVAVLQFNDALSKLSPEMFVKKYIVDAFNVKHLTVGDDFHFGRNREGNFERLKAFSRDYNFKVEQMETFEIEEKRISSSLIRECLVSGDLQKASHLLGRSYSISGRVAHGDKRGRELGFPTANIFLYRDRASLNGIMAALVHGLSNVPLPAVAYVGRRPAIKGEREILEVHILNFDEDIYGRLIQVDFLEKLRDDMDFPSLEGLTKQMAIDIEQAKTYFEPSKSPENVKVN